MIARDDKSGRLASQRVRRGGRTHRPATSAHLDIPVDDSASVQRPEPSQDLSEQVGAFSMADTAVSNDEGVRVAPVGPIKDHDRRVEHGRLKDAVEVFHDVSVDEDITEPGQVTQVEVILRAHAGGMETLMKPQACHQFGVYARRGDLVAGFVEELHRHLLVDVW